MFKKTTVLNRTLRALRLIKTCMQLWLLLGYIAKLAIRIYETLP
jgi:hypothetical protein